MFDKEYYATLPHGEDSLAYLKKCIAEADNEKNIEEMLRHRHEYMYESVFYGDKCQMMLTFPEFLKLYEENPGAVEPDCALYPFMWMVEDSPKYWQITREQIDKYIERFKVFLERNGYDMQQYYLRSSGAYEYIDIKIAAEYLREFEELYEAVKTKDDTNAEASRVFRDMYTGDISRGLNRLNELLKTHDVLEFPVELFGDIAYHLALNGYYDEADYYADMMLRLMNRERWAGSAMWIARVIAVKTVTEVHRAYDIFCECAGIYSTMKDPAARFWFAAAAYRLMEALEKQDITEIHPHLSSDFELYSADRNYDTAKLKDYFYRTARELAGKFDKRNGNTMFSDVLTVTFPDAPESKLELPIHGTITPSQIALGVLFEDELPTFDDVADALKEKFGYEKINVMPNDDGQAAFIGAIDKNGTRLSYGVVYTDAPEAEWYRSMHYMPEHALDDIGSYTRCLMLISDNTHMDRFEDMRRMLVLAEAMNTGGCPVVYNINSLLAYPSGWLHYLVLSETPPSAEECVRYRNSPSEAVPDAMDIVTTGLGIFGSRELAVTAVSEDEYRGVIFLLSKLVSAISFASLPDEERTMNTGLVYDNKSFIQMSWTQHTFSDGDGVFAEPVLYPDAASVRGREGKRLNEVTGEELEKIRPRQHSLALDFDQTRSSKLFPYALEYYRLHDCKMIAGICYDTGDPGGDILYLACELSEDGSEGTVLDNGEYYGKVLPVKADDVYFFRIVLPDGDSYFADELYILMQEEG